MTNLYSLHNVLVSGTAFSAEVRFDRNHPVFSGHFPGKPVVPGVFLVEIIAAIISQFIGKQLIVKEAINLKFLQPIDPGEHSTIWLEGSIAEEGHEIFKVDATFRQGELLFAKMKGVKLEP